VEDNQLILNPLLVTAELKIFCGGFNPVVTGTEEDEAEPYVFIAVTTILY